MNKQRTCPYCDNVLDYRGFDTSIDLITEEWWCENCKEFLYLDEPGIRPQSEDVESDDEVDDDEPFELGVHRMIPGLWRLSHDANGVTSMELVSEDTATVASQPDGAGGDPYAPTSPTYATPYEALAFHITSATVAVMPQSTWNNGWTPAQTVNELTFEIQRLRAAIQEHAEVIRTHEDRKTVFCVDGEAGRGVASQPGGAGGGGGDTRES